MHKSGKYFRHVRTIINEIPFKDPRNMHRVEPDQIFMYLKCVLYFVIDAFTKGHVKAIAVPENMSKLTVYERILMFNWIFSKLNVTVKDRSIAFEWYFISLQPVMKRCNAPLLSNAANKTAKLVFKNKKSGQSIFVLIRCRSTATQASICRESNLFLERKQLHLSQKTAVVKM